MTQLGQHEQARLREADPGNEALAEDAAPSGHGQEHDGQLMSQR